MHTLELFRGKRYPWDHCRESINTGGENMCLFRLSRDKWLSNLRAVMCSTAYVGMYAPSQMCNSPESEGLVANIRVNLWSREQWRSRPQAVSRLAPRMSIFRNPFVRITMCVLGDSLPVTRASLIQWNCDVSNAERTAAYVEWTCLYSSFV